MMKRFLTALLSCCLFIVPSYATSEDINYESSIPLYSVEIVADVPNGVTDNVTAIIVPDGPNEAAESYEVFLYRVNNFTTHLRLPADDYILQDINVYNDDAVYKKQQKFSVEKEDGGAAVQVKIVVNGGKKNGESTNTRIEDIKGISTVTLAPEITIAPLEENLSNTTSSNTEISIGDVSEKHPIKRILTVVLLCLFSLIVYYFRTHRKK